ncbi:hypothetical protein YC2023_098222 [Brassica napus]
MRVIHLPFISIFDSSPKATLVFTDSSSSTKMLLFLHMWLLAPQPHLVHPSCKPSIAYLLLYSFLQHSWTSLQLYWCLEFCIQKHNV